MNKIVKYYFIHNGNAELLKFNPYLENVGYEFVQVSAADLEGNGNVIKFGNMSDFEELHKFISVDGNNTINESVVNSYLVEFLQDFHNYSDATDEMISDYVVLKRRNGAVLESASFSLTELIEQASFREEKELVSKLNIFLFGNVFIYGCISIDTTHNKLLSFDTTACYDPQKWDIQVLKGNDSVLNNLFKKDFKIPEMLELAFSVNNNYFEVKDSNLRFVSIITALESIFNKSSTDPIQHILARHCALLVSKNQEQFRSNFKLLKELYSVRSSIVHGETNKKKLDKIKNEMPMHLAKANFIFKSVLRELLNQSFTPQFALNKEMLFEKLNVEGIYH